jgi:GNAT superfamily N-acetyltransferase
VSVAGFSRVAKPLAVLRRAYLASLPEPQEWFLEELVRDGETWQLGEAGYAVIRGDRLVEFYAEDRTDGPALLRDLMRHRPFDSALCKSFDAGLMEAAKALGWQRVETGFLFRKRVPVSAPRPPGFRLARAQRRDVSEIWQTGQDFYDSAAEVVQLFQDGALWAAFNDAQMVGSGVTLPIDGSGAVVDIGMVVRAERRGAGLGRAIVCALADRLEREGKRPICGCGQSNHASKGALENAGFVSEHRLVRLSP